jgi:uncharacterized protein (TIGR03790 family)
MVLSMSRLFVCFLSIAIPAQVWGQVNAPTEFTGKDVWVIVNSNMVSSVALGEFYCSKRQVPMEQLIKLDLPEGEEMSRVDYENKLLKPLREKFKGMERKDFILLTTYGVPIRVGAASPKPDEVVKLEVIRKEIARLGDELKILQEAVKQAQEAGDRAKANSMKPDIAKATAAQQNLVNQESQLSYKESYASVDNELAMMWYPSYPLTRWQLNFRFFTITERARANLPKIVMTCRIDGPTPQVAKRIVEDALKAEAAGGLQGYAYVDARGLEWKEKGADVTAGSYGGFDESLREFAKLLDEMKFKTTLNNVDNVFPPGTCPKTALYCGWYALQNYTPAFELVPGSIAIHVASFEAISLRERHNRRWVPNLLQDGACVTLGPVQEPYLIAFPKPNHFFGFLFAGHTVVESYWLTCPFTSWQIMIIGDPLYRPFGKEPRMKSSEVKLSPVGSQYPPRIPK